MIDRRRFLAAAGATGLLAASGTRPAAAAPSALTVTTGHPTTFLWARKVQDVWLPAINSRLEAAGQDPIRFTEAYGTVARPGSELQTIGDGVSDMGYVSTLFHPADLPLQNVSFMCPFGSGDLGTVVRVGDAMNGAISALPAAFRRHNQVVLAGAGVDSYHLFTTFPIETLGALDGRRLAAPGPTGNWLGGTGAIAVASNLNEYYNNIQLGVVDGAVTFASAAAPAKLVEVAPHVTLVDFGAMYVGALTVNADIWDRLAEEERDIFAEAAGEWRNALIEAQQASAAAALDGMKAAGADIRPSPEDLRATWAGGLPDLARAWAQTMEGTGLPGTEVVNAFVAGLEEHGTTLPRRWSA